MWLRGKQFQNQKQLSTKNNHGGMMEPLGLVQGEGSHHLPAPYSLQSAGTVRDIKYPCGTEPSWGRNLCNFNPDWLLGNLSILQLRRRKPSEGTCSQVTHMWAQGGPDSSILIPSPRLFQPSCLPLCWSPGWILALQQFIGEPSDICFIQN